MEIVPLISGKIGEEYDVLTRTYSSILVSAVLNIDTEIFF